MRRKYIILFFFMLNPGFLASQDVGNPVVAIEKKLKSFEYAEAIHLSNAIINNTSDWPDSLLNEVFRIRAIAYYSLGNEREAIAAFLTLMQRKPGFQFDPVKTSPKIIRYFEDIRINYLNNRPAPADSLPMLATTDRLYSGSTPGGNAVMRSLILPGWGHLHKDSRTKGWLLTLSSAVMLGAAVFYTIDTRKKESDYLAVSTSGKFDAAYEAYNTAYQRRNVLWTGYLVLWLYSQVDLLYFSGKTNKQIPQLNISKRFSMKPFFQAQRPAFGWKMSITF